MISNANNATLTAALELLVTVGYQNKPLQGACQLPAQLSIYIDPADGDSSWRNDGTGYSFPGWEMGR